MTFSAGEIYASITAGGRVNQAFAKRIGTPFKALARIGDQSLLEIAIGAARTSGVAAIAVVGGADVRNACNGLVERVIDASVDGVENMRRALYAWGNRRLLYMTSDLPFIRAEAILEFQRLSAADTISMPVATARAYECLFPGAPPHETNVGGERIASGSVFLLPAGCAARVEEVAGAFFRARKHPLKMARLLGPSCAVRFMTGRLRIEHIEKRARDVLRTPAAAVRECSPSLCYDVDSLADYDYARRYGRET